MGALLEGDEVIAFSPATFIGPLARLVHRDRRAPRLFLRACVSPDRRVDYFDLKKVFRTHQGLLVASPEYNSSITPLLKNTIDWVAFHICRATVIHS